MKILYILLITSANAALNVYKNFKTFMAFEIIKFIKNSQRHIEFEKKWTILCQTHAYLEKINIIDN